MVVALLAPEPVPVPAPVPAPPAGAWYVYVLWSLSRGRSYVGISLDVARRLRQHDGEAPGGASATRAGRPWCLVACFGPFPDRAAVSRAERAVKAARGLARLRWCPPAEPLATVPP